jgi:peptidoglycan/LPS O-acetylase OafA/YrhL
MVRVWHQRIKALLSVSWCPQSIGWFSLLPDEFKELGKYIVGGAAFADNFVAWQESDYFAREAELRPLLHLWSLSIEEQFYLLWPLTLWLGFRAKINLMALVVVLVVASFLFNVHGIAHDKAATFYAPWCRFWEILSGGVLAYLHRGTRPDAGGPVSPSGSGPSFRSRA